MNYQHIIKAEFLSRPNRFIAHVKINGETVIAHVKNTGRCRELLIPGCAVYLEVSSNPARKTKYDLVAVEKVTDRGVILINMDSAAPNAAALEWLLAGGLLGPDCTVRPEVRYGDSRFDFYLEKGDRRAFVEVKGVTLEENGIAAFPDAPTDRGVKHIHELIRAREDGYESYILFVIQMKGVHLFHPNDLTHKAFGDALRTAHAAGVKLLVRDCTVTPDTMAIDREVEYNLQGLCP